MIKKIVVIFGSLMIILFIGGLAGHFIKGVAIRECVDKGGVWDYRRSSCDCYEIPDSSAVTSYTWFKVFDFCDNEYRLLKGAEMDQNNFTSWELIRLLNQRERAYTIQLESQAIDTIKLSMTFADSLELRQVNSDYLIGYYAETVYTLTEYGEFLWVEFLADDSQKSQSKVYGRESFSGLIEIQ